MSPTRDLAVVALLLAATGSLCAQDSSFTVTVVPPLHGKVQLTPPLPADGKYAAGAVVTLTATPDSGYTLDSTWYQGRGMAIESPNLVYKITVDQDRRVGASFIAESAVKDIAVTNNVVYAKPGVKALKYDVFSPKGARGLPIIMIVHGGGWTANCEDVMRGLAREMAKDGKFVAVSMDYRWLGKGDGDATANTMADLIGDVFGGIAHVMEHAAAYGGDPTRIGVTGDSAGGHLAAVASLMTNMIGSRGFGKTPGVYEFMPTYLPNGKTAEQVRDEMVKAIKAGAPSYGVFSPARLKRFASETAGDQSVEAIAPLAHIPLATERSVPQFLTRGTRDGLITNADVQEFTDALVKAGQPVEYVQIGGAGHAFFDWKPDERTKATFARYGVYYASQMKGFFMSVLY
jgi:acetyl esterase/lipase